MKLIIKRTVNYISFLFFISLFFFLFTGNAIAQLAMTPDGGALADGATGVIYSESITGENCVDYVWNLSSGSLPDGLTYGSSQTSGNWDGNPIVISGTPTVVGDFSFDLTLTADCGTGPRGGLETIVRSFTISILSSGDPVITTINLPDGLLSDGTNNFYSVDITGVYGITPYTWNLISGSLPTGLTYGASQTSGTWVGNPLVISGYPTALGTWAFTVELTDAAGKTFSTDFTINISNILITTPSPLPDGLEGSSYSVTLAGTGGDSAGYVWTVPADSDFPPGLNLSESGVLSGLPTAEGSYYFLVELTDGANFTSKWFDLYIAQNDLIILTNSLPTDSNACVSYSATVTGEGGTTPYAWNVLAGSLPPGLELTALGTPSTSITGIPTAVGDFSFTVSISDANGVTRRKSFSISIIGDASGCSVDIIEKTAYPPFVLTQELVKPNILLVLDNSGSMYEFAYKKPGRSNRRMNSDTNFDPSTNYYGYFECNPDDASQIMYSYYGNAESNPSPVPALNEEYFFKDPAGVWEGCFLNWLTMRRVDVARKVLVGGKVEPRDPSTDNFLIAAPKADRNRWKGYGGQTYRVYSEDGYSVFRVCTDPRFGACNRNNVSVYRVVINVGTTVPEGIVQKTYDRVRWGLMFFNATGKKYEDGGSTQEDGGYVKTELGGPLTDLVTNIESEDPSTWTPLAETMYEAVRYYQQAAAGPAYEVDDYPSVDPIEYWCQDNFMIVLTDGESTKDMNIPGGFWSGTVAQVSDSNFDVKTYMDSIAANELATTASLTNLAGLPWADEYDTAANSMEGTYYLEGVAFYAHKTDLRPDLEGTQHITTYTVFAFDESGVGRAILSTSAKYGGFIDQNNNNLPDLQSEWNQDGDAQNIPDNYFEAGEGSVLYDSLMTAINSILERASSGTSSAVLSTSGDGEGAVYQAYFNPKKNGVAWVGNVHGLFLDKHGNIREDSRGDARLCYGPDDPVGCTDANTIISMYFDLAAAETKVNRYPGGVDDQGNPTGTAITVSLDDINTIWDAGERLWAGDANSRKIFTTLNGYDSTGLSEDLIKGTFHDGNAAVTDLQAALGVGSSADAADIINYIRGIDVSEYRSRDMLLDLDGNGPIAPETRVWKLGDLVYSTPMVVPQPKENYDLLYNDLSYYYFKLNYIDRRHVVYAGANDGMLHAFNAGFYDINKLRYCKGGDSDKSWEIDDTECAGDASSPELGDELWGFVPRGVLPDLSLLMRNDYTHVYYVDLQPKVSDVKIFTRDTTTHIGLDGEALGWGTILIGGLRYGAKESINTTPEYFALDVTDPKNPRVLWTFSDPDLGLSMSYPAVARTCDSSGANCEWFAIFGSGPTNYDTNSNLTAFQPGNIYVLKISSGTNGVISSWIEGTNFWKFPATSGSGANAFMSNPITVDVDLDYAVDAIYIAENYQAGGNVCSDSLVASCNTDADCASPATCVPIWNTKMLRLTTGNGTFNSPSSWTLSTLADISKIDTSGNDKARRVTSAPVAVLDEVGKLWVFFGTGQFLGSADKNQPTNSGFYGVKDLCWDGSCFNEYTNLLDVSDVVICAENADATTCTGTDFSTLETNIVENYDGWAIYHNSSSLVESVDFEGQVLTHTGERVITSPAVVGGLVVWPTFMPDAAACSLGGESNLYSVYYKTGSAYKDYTFEAQKEKVAASGTQEAVARVIKAGEGMPSSVSVQVNKSGGAKGFMQSSNGTIIEIQFDPPLMMITEPKAWLDEEIK